MQRALLLIIMLGLISCTKKNEADNFDMFVFSASGEPEDYSLKFTPSDTVYMQRRYPRPEKIFYTLINQAEKDSFNLARIKIDFTKYDSIYFQQNMVDGETIKFYSITKGKSSSILFYGHKAPKELYDYDDWFIRFKETHKFHATLSKQDFGNLHNILLPPPPPVELYLKK